MHEALDRRGAGAGGTRNISGTNHYHVLLETELADLHGKESALLFTSGDVSNLATLSTPASRLPGCIVLSNARNHASMIEGIRHSRAETRTFAHNDPDDLARQLKGIDPSLPSWWRSSRSIPWMEIRRRSPISAMGRTVWGNDVPRLSPCRRAVRATRRRNIRAGRAKPQVDGQRGYAGEGLWYGRWLHCRVESPLRSRPELRFGIHLYDGPAAVERGGCLGKRPARSF